MLMQYSPPPPDPHCPLIDTGREGLGVGSFEAAVLCEAEGDVPGGRGEGENEDDGVWEDVVEDELDGDDPVQAPNDGWHPVPQ